MPNGPKNQIAKLRWPRRTTSFLVSALLLSGCTRVGPSLETYSDVAGRARQDPQSFVLEAHSRWDNLLGMVGSYQIRSSQGVGSQTMNTQIYLLRDRFLDIQVLAPTGSTEAYLVAGESEVGFWASDENRLYKGPSDPGEFGRALGINLSPAAVVAVLMGYGVDIGSGDHLSAQWDETVQRIRVTLAETSAWLHPVSGRFERVLVRTASGLIEIEYEAWSEVGPPVPLRMRVEVPTEDITLELRLAAEWQANPKGLDKTYFDVYPVSGAVDAPLSLLQAKGGLLHRGLSQ
jgi:hypothetical protein